MIISKGAAVNISYSIKDQEDRIIEQNDVPITYIHKGKHDLFDQIEDALEGKSKGDEVVVKITAKDAFGLHDPSLTFTDDLENSPVDIRYLGAKFDAESPSGEDRHFVVTRIENGKITIDANHVMAGKDLTFIVKVEEVRSPTEGEIAEQGKR